MKERYKIYNFLFDGKCLKEVSLNAKVAYGIYVDMLKENINVKQDERGCKYIENARKYIIVNVNIKMYNFWNIIMYNFVHYYIRFPSQTLVEFYLLIDMNFH